MSADASRPRLPGAVLFACNFNRVRSPMAEALLKRAMGDRIYVDSCGLSRAAEDEAGEGADPFVQAVMAEISVDLARHEPKTFEDLTDSSFDLVISLTPQAQHRAVEMTRGRAAAPPNSSVTPNRARDSCAQAAVGPLGGSQDKKLNRSRWRFVTLK